MEFYIVRRPVFDSKLNIFLYDLVYENNKQDEFSFHDTSRAAVELVSNIFNNMEFSTLTGKKNAIITFPNELINRKIPLLFPKDKVWINIINATAMEAQTLTSFLLLKEENYKFVMDDFSFTEKEKKLINLFDIVKINFKKFSLSKHKAIINEYHEKTSFMATDLDTREDYLAAVKAGYTYLQGRFFSKPVVLKGKGIEAIKTSYLEMLSETNKKNPSFDKLEEIAKKDLSITYQLLKTANSVFYGTRHKIVSIKQALVRIGLNEIRRWVYLMVLRNPSDTENSELIKTCMIRGKFMEQLSTLYKPEISQSDCFITGILSSIDVILHRDMEQILKELALPEIVKEALLGVENDLYMLLKYVEAYEKGEWSKVNEFNLFRSEIQDRIPFRYMESLKWADNID
ncbi:MAG: HDOD domain-containing protein [Clostridia bacterium]|nr:HDOD domain-containing protein [Clostridia bacterium]